MKHIFENIELSNFRGFDHLNISGLSKVNVLLGNNNVGKTSILEAFFMLSGMSNPLMATKINNIRLGRDNNSLDDARYIFHNVDLSVNPTIKGHSNLGERQLAIIPDFTYSNNDGSQLSHTEIRSLNFEFRNSAKENFHSSVFLDSDKKQKIQTDGGYAEAMNCIFIPADKQDRNALTNFTNLVKRGKKQEVLNEIRSFDADIENIEALPGSIYVGKKGVKELLPISMIGDGMRRIINIVSTVISEDYNVVLIDEFDNGLHYTAHKSVWECVLRFVARHDIQLIATTHNLESLQSLKSVLDNNTDLQQDVAVFDIANTKKKGFQAFRYGYQDLKEAINNEIEIRK